MDDGNKPMNDVSNRFAGDGPFTPNPHTPVPNLPYAPLAPNAPNAKPPLDAPWYGIGFGNAIVRLFRKTFIYSGRASRGEYWWSQLFMLIALVAVGLVANVVASAFGVSDPAGPVGSFSEGFADGVAGKESAGTPLTDIVTFSMAVAQLVLFLPGLSLSIRRLHDENLRGWWFLAPLGVILAGIIGGAGLVIGAASDGDALNVPVLVIALMLVIGAYVLSELISIVMMILPSNPKGARFDKPSARVGVVPAASGSEAPRWR